MTALSVDHGLRAESADEVRQIAEWLQKRNIAFCGLKWDGVKPQTGIQEAARRARFNLLRHWCRAHGVLHLLLAHHQEDQAETFLLRLKGRSGADGLAGMAPLVEESDVRILRPVLNQPKKRLQAVLEACGQSWLEDPSNRNTRYGRVSLRFFMPQLNAVGLSVPLLATASKNLGMTRMQHESELASLAARSLCLYPAGVACCDLKAVLKAGLIGEMMVRRLLACIGKKKDYAPALQGVHRILRAVQTGKSGAFSLSGCLLIPRYREGRLWICRELRRNENPVSFFDTAGESVWDERFSFRLSGKNVSSGVWSVQALGKKRAGVLMAENFQANRSLFPEALDRCVYAHWPHRVYHTLPAIFHDDILVAVPHVGYIDKTQQAAGGVQALSARFMPAKPITISNDYLAYQ